MNQFQAQDMVAEIVAQRPGLSRVFEEAGIDYCCKGNVTLQEACAKKGLSLPALIQSLEETDAQRAGKSEVDMKAMSLTELADHIEQTHHQYLRTELPRLDHLTAKVASAHGAQDPRLHQVRETFLNLAEELMNHMNKEERVLFPMIRALEASPTAPVFPCGSLQNPIAQMEQEHDHAGHGLETLSELTDRYTPPVWACNTYRAMLDSLAHLQSDLHGHIHKENYSRFPRAIEMEQAKQAV